MTSFPTTTATNPPPPPGPPPSRNEHGVGPQRMTSFSEGSPRSESGSTVFGGPPSHVSFGGLVADSPPPRRLLGEDSKEPAGSATKAQPKPPPPSPRDEPAADGGVVEKLLSETADSLPDPAEDVAVAAPKKLPRCPRATPRVPPWFAPRRRRRA